MGFRLRTALVFLIAAFVTACGGASTYVRGLSGQQKSQARVLPVYEHTLADGGYRVVQRVEGISCRVNAIDNDPVSEEEATEELQYAAFKAGGTAVMEVTCDRPGFARSEYACAESIVCSGVAVVQTYTP